MFSVVAIVRVYYVYGALYQRVPLSLVTTLGDAALAVPVEIENKCALRNIYKMLRNTHALAHT